MASKAFVVKIFYFCLIFFMLASNSLADQWVLIAKGKNFTEYFKNSSRTGRFASIDALRNYDFENTPKNQKFLSKKTSIQFDCSRKRFKVISVEKYDKEMARGKLIKKIKNELPWTDVEKNTLHATYLKKTCGVSMN